MMFVSCVCVAIFVRSRKRSRRMRHLNKSDSSYVQAAKNYNPSRCDCRFAETVVVVVQQSIVFFTVASAGTDMSLYSSAVQDNTQFTSPTPKPVAKQLPATPCTICCLD